MRLLMDENLPHELDRRLRESGMDVLRVHTGTSDQAMASMAKREGRIILTFDKDFSNTFLFPPRKFHGIIRIKIHPPIIEDIINALSSLFRRHSFRDLNKKLVVLERDGFRIQA